MADLLIEALFYIIGYIIAFLITCKSFKKWNSAKLDNLDIVGALLIGFFSWGAVVFVSGLALVNVIVENSHKICVHEMKLTAFINKILENKKESK